MRKERPRATNPTASRSDVFPWAFWPQKMLSPGCRSTDASLIIRRSLIPRCLTQTKPLEPHGHDNVAVVVLVFTVGAKKTLAVGIPQLEDDILTADGREKVQ